MNDIDWEQELGAGGALWIHDGNGPHALLTSGNHSDGFFNASQVIKHPTLVLDVCLHWKDLMASHDFHWVIGSAMGVVTLAHQMALILGGSIGGDVYTGFTEPMRDDDGEKQMVLKRFTLEPGQQVLVVEDVLTTGDTTRKTIQAIKVQGAKVTMVAVILNRSGHRHINGLPIVSLLDKQLQIWPPHMCPLCADGSEAVRPKENWDLLTAS